MSQTKKLMPNLDQQSTKVLNLTVLQRFDPSIQEILLTAAHVALYEFNVSLGQWSRKDVQGSLFVVKRNKDPWYQFIVMNQINTENHVENLSGNFEFDVQVPYLLYRNIAEEVNGLWFYNSSECEVVADLFNRIIESYARSTSEPLVNKSEYKEVEPVRSVAVMGIPLEPSPVPSSTSINAAVATENAISRLFDAAANISNSGKPVQSYHPSSNYLVSTGISNSIPTPAGHLQASSVATSAPAVHLINQHEADSGYGSSQIANLVTPAIFHNPHSSSSTVSMPPISSSLPLTALQSSLSVQRPYGAPFLQPYPPPAPSPFLTPQTVAATTHGPVIDRESVRAALMALAQDNECIDMFWKALQRVHRG
ncbi:mRNA-decapping enzyme-like protein [Amaranthus tricolor]|uniref:mRNA-decapping enzyme-like protein n=1 Tax=Amaranthus tricolor TaxID=29722 RepID=UPI00258996DD|nr:mRNA-decapping enzyme-like protein [Amaranthus tricolor]